MRLDHIAYRVLDRAKTADFFIHAMGYRLQTEFDLNFDDGSTTKCIALEPPEKRSGEAFAGQDTSVLNFAPGSNFPKSTYHIAPEIFVSDGSPDSIVGKWVAERGVGGIHHIAYAVDSVEETMKEWINNEWATFASEEPLSCPGLVQVFTNPHPLTGLIYEFIERNGEYGFCVENVQALMESTRDIR